MKKVFLIMFFFIFGAQNILHCKQYGFGEIKEKLTRKQFREYCKLLDVQETNPDKLYNASSDEKKEILKKIKKKYRKESFKAHPDRARDEEDRKKREEKFKNLTRANFILKELLDPSGTYTIEIRKKREELIKVLQEITEDIHNNTLKPSYQLDKQSKTWDQIVTFVIDKHDSNYHYTYQGNRENSYRELKHYIFINLQDLFKELFSPIDDAAMIIIRRNHFGVEFIEKLANYNISFSTKEASKYKNEAFQQSMLLIKTHGKIKNKEVKKNKIKKLCKTLNTHFIRGSGLNWGNQFGTLPRKLKHAPKDLKIYVMNLFEASNYFDKYKRDYQRYDTFKDMLKQQSRFSKEKKKKLPFDAFYSIQDFNEYLDWYKTTFNNLIASFENWNISDHTYIRKIEEDKLFGYHAFLTDFRTFINNRVRQNLWKTDSFLKRKLQKIIRLYEKLNLSTIEMHQNTIPYKEFYNFFDPEIINLERMNNHIKSGIFSRTYNRKSWNDYFAYLLNKYYHPEKKELNGLFKKTMQNLLGDRAHIQIAFTPRGYSKTPEILFEDLDILYLDSIAFIKKDFAEINHKRVKELVETLKTYDEGRLLKKIYPESPRKMDPGYKKILGNLFKFNAFFNKVKSDTKRYNLFKNIKAAMDYIYNQWLYSIQSDTDKRDYFFAKRKETINEIYFDWKDVDEDIQKNLKKHKTDEYEWVEKSKKYLANMPPLTLKVSALANKLSEIKNTTESLSNALGSIKDRLR